MALRLIISILILAVPAELPGCGPFLPEALFFQTLQPEDPAAFAQGNLGIIQPGYERFFQVVAYRYLAGTGLNDAERQAIFQSVPGWQASSFVSPPQESQNPWLVARNIVPGITQLRYIPTIRIANELGHFEMYENCHDDAFTTAAVTLDRIQGLDNPGPAVADWIAAQDVVFSDCSNGSAIPQPAADPRLRADRAYQVASAKFYSRQYDAARADFEAIAQDTSSPWHGIAPYLVARCLIRADKLADAAAALQRIASDPALDRWHAPAASLLTYVETHLHPQQRMHDAAMTLLHPDSQQSIARDLTDYLFLFDKSTRPQPADDLTDWILSFQAGGQGALERWRAQHTLPWLVASLEAARPADTAAPELIAAVRALKPDSPGYLTAGYYMVRLLPPDQARAEADELLAADLPVAARNQIRAQRMRLARDFDEFLRYAPRRPVADLTDDVRPAGNSADLLDDDSALLLNRDVPIGQLKQAATSDLLPAGIRQQLQDVISVRALLLSKSPAFDAVFALLNTPGSGPYVRSGDGRFTGDPAKIDPYRDNWWCSAGAPGNPYLPRPPQPPDSGAWFLSAADREQAAKEWGALEASPAAADWLGAQTLAFAQAHPQDPRVPEALYLVVRATRYGCTDKQTGDISHRAFDLLHRRYPASEWTKKTPYWFN